MARATDEATMLIERVFRSKRMIEIAVYEKKHKGCASNFTGGSNTGHCRVPDPTAIEAIRNAIELETVTLEDGFRLQFPERWLRVFYAVRNFCKSDPVDSEIFLRRYERGETGIPVTVEQSVYSRHLLKIRNYAKVCAAQEQLMRFF